MFVFVFLICLHGDIFNRCFRHKDSVNRTQNNKLVELLYLCKGYSK